MLRISLSTLSRFDPLTHPSTGPEAAQESQRTTSGVRAIVLTHHWFNSVGSLVSVVERNSANIVMQDMSLDDAVEKVPADKSELTINSRCSTACEVPTLGLVVG